MRIGRSMRALNGTTNLDAAGLADDRHPLVVADLGRAGEGQMPPAGELDQRARQPVGAELRIEVEARHDPGRLGAEDVAGGQDRVAADVVERAAARRLVADVVGVEQAIGEEGLDRARFPDRARARDLARAPPLRMVAHHERLGDELAGPRARGDQRLRLVGVKRDRLLAQHVLAGLQRADRPGDVQLVGQRIVDRLDRRIGEQLLIGAVGAGDAERGGRRPRLGEIARGDRVDARDLAALHGGNDLLEADIGGAEHAPRDFTRHPILPFAVSAAP